MRFGGIVGFEIWRLGDWVMADAGEGLQIIWRPIEFDIE